MTHAWTLRPPPTRRKTLQSGTRTRSPGSPRRGEDDRLCIPENARWVEATTATEEREDRDLARHQCRNASARNPSASDVGVGFAWETFFHRLRQSSSLLDSTVYHEMGRVSQHGFVSHEPKELDTDTIRHLSSNCSVYPSPRPRIDSRVFATSSPTLRLCQ